MDFVVDAIAIGNHRRPRPPIGSRRMAKRTAKKMRGKGPTKRAAAKNPETAPNNATKKIAKAAPKTPVKKDAMSAPIVVAVTRSLRLTPRSGRRKRLLCADVPATFLDLAAGLKTRGDKLQWFRDEGDAYFYLGEAAGEEIDPSSPWGCLADQDVTPVYSGGNGDTFILLLSAKDGTRRFIDFGLEDGLLTDFGSNFQLVLANLVIEIYEITDKSSPDQIVEIATELGFVRPKELVDALEQSSRPTFETDRAWRAEVLPRLIS